MIRLLGGDQGTEGSITVTTKMGRESYWNCSGSGTATARPTTSTSSTA
jgi:hypothetical protein